jgi:thiol-disulfide isomerase/thioredoxin
LTERRIRSFFSPYCMLPPIHINNESSLTSQWTLVEQYVDQGKDVYIFIHKQGCPPCIKTWPHWSNIRYRNPSVVLVDVDQALLFESGSETGKKAKTWLEQQGSEIQGFPTIRLYKKGAKPLDYDWSTYGGPPTEKSLLHFFRDNSTIYQEYKPGQTKPGQTKRSMRGGGTKKKRVRRRRRPIRSSRVRSR